jgi:signal peptidase I
VTTPTPPATSSRRRTGRWLLEWAKSIAIALVVWMFLRTFVIEAFRIPSGSMQQTLKIGDHLFVNKFLYGAEVPLIHKRLPAVREPRRDEIIVFDSVEDPDMKVVKRLMGVPGDTLQMRAGALFRNGNRLDEPYAVPIDPGLGEDPLMRARMREWQVEHFAGTPPRSYAPDLHDWGPIVVPAESLFVMGDNRDGSYDGRYWGFLPRINVRGKPVLVYYSYDSTSPANLAAFTEVRWRRIFSVPH